MLLLVVWWCAQRLGDSIQITKDTFSVTPKNMKIAKTRVLSQNPNKIIGRI
jgi:hypothetical protein